MRARALSWSFILSVTDPTFSAYLAAARPSKLKIIAAKLYGAETNYYIILRPHKRHAKRLQEGNA